jgi:1-acyl-sn-glycerol-3-phosphate acyltransferase
MASKAGWMVVALVAALVGSFLRVVFALTLLLFILPVCGACKLLGLLSPAVISARTLSGIALVLTQAAFSATLKVCSFWVRLVPADDTQQQWAALKSGLGGDRPAMILGNHTSFLDTLITISTAPVGVMWNMKTYFNHALVNMPILGSIIKAQQQFSVPFKGTADGDFSVDREAMAKVDLEVDAFISGGGVLCFFPEGQLNAMPTTLLPFRYGGMKKALAHDAQLWAFVTRGCQLSWPKKAQVGGFPGDGNYSLRPLAPDGCRQLVADLKASGKYGAAGGGKADYEILAKELQEKMQMQYDHLGSLGSIFCESPPR